MRATRFYSAFGLAFVLAWVLTAGIPGFTAEVHAAVDVFDFETAEQEQRFRELSNEFRCPMCQNANLSSSPGGVAADLRREIYRMIMEGQTDQQIEEFMLARYGDFILYRPRLTMQTVLLWFGPLLFLVIGIWVAYSIMRRSGRESPEATSSLSGDEEARLKALLAQKKNGASDKA
ncbi:MAG: cytochrome c-type biogenesis protein CcmH [Gammaproteobacteria bacterium]|nr:cytochrome c-type biogenesis protein CcmH [Gammaproteobacteria bacterium]|tara:strand:+ start:1867 stop:2394 length:528 start_codon:yes stop_codon:yes gene_type:complete